MFESVLIANRGEIACRVIRTLRDLGIRSIAVYSEADAGSRHVHEADEAVCIGPPPAIDSYLRIEAVIDAARRTGAQAIHPGYGFLSENPAFAQACAAAGITFIGPPVAAIESMGDKIAAKNRVAAAGVPVVPGTHDDHMTDDDVAVAVERIGFPAMLKPSAGGGGKGMRVIRAGSDLRAEIETARREAVKSFGDDRLLVERYIERPRHIEVQVLADQHGGVIHLGERECSLQRRHQKVIEEAPSPFITPDTRERLGSAAIETARSCGYVGAGTVEFIVDGTDPDSFYFLEMNTRLQVEHPVTELVTGWDLVEWQLRIAAGEPLPDAPVTITGHAIEARIYAEDPARDFLPSTGTVLAVHDSPNARVDSGVMAGQTISSNYDPMISKVIVGAGDREAALDGLIAALDDTQVLGVTTNTGFLARLLAVPEVRKGDLHTGLIEEQPDITAESAPDERILAVAGMEWLLRMWQSASRTGDDAWSTPDGWRLSGAAPAGLVIRSAAGVHPIAISGSPREAIVVVDGGTPMRASAQWSADGAGPEARQLVVTIDGRTGRYQSATGSDGRVWFAGPGVVGALAFAEVDRLAAESGDAAGASVGAIRSPMPGSVIAVAVAPGDVVAAGAPLVTVEAMKMEHTLVAPAAALVAEVPVQLGGQVAMDQVLVRLEAVDE